MARRNQIMKKLLYFSFLVYFGLGCGRLSFFSKIPSYFREEIDPGLTFTELRKEPKAYMEKKVLLGGVITEIQNNPLETELRILQKPLDQRNIPIEKGYTSGQFIAVYKGYLDRLVYAPGRLITIGGKVIGQKIKDEYGRIYTYPVIMIDFLQLRPVQAPYFYPPWFEPKTGEEIDVPF